MSVSEPCSNVTSSMDGISDDFDSDKAVASGRTEDDIHRYRSVCMCGTGKLSAASFPTVNKRKSNSSSPKVESCRGC